MRSILTASITALAMATALASAQAADIPRRAAMPAKAPVYLEPVFSWTGPYIGINGGGGWGRSNFSGPFATGSFPISGGLLGVTAGYNWQSGVAVFGLEGDIDWSNIRGNTPCAGTTCETRNSWLGTLRGRIGYGAGRFMPYVTGGLAVGDIRTNITGVGTANTTKAGWTLGAGIEAALSNNVSAKFEYLYVDLGRGGGVPGTGSDASFRSNILRAGLNYRF